MLKKGDVIVAIALIVIAGILFLAGLHPGQGNTVVIQQDGKAVYAGPLNQDFEISLQGDYENKIVVRDGSVYYEESNCPGKDCVKTGHISKGGQSAACLPNRTSVFITSTEGGVDAIAK